MSKNNDGSLDVQQQARGVETLLFWPNKKRGFKVLAHGSCLMCDMKSLFSNSLLFIHLYENFTQCVWCSRDL